MGIIKSKLGKYTLFLFLNIFRNSLKDVKYCNSVLPEFTGCNTFGLESYSLFYMEKQYLCMWCPSMVAGFCWTLMRDVPEAK